MRNPKAELAIIILFLSWVVFYFYNNGKNRETYVLKVIEITGAASDSECAEIAKTFGFNKSPESISQYGFWDYIDAGSSSIQAGNVFMLLAEYSYQQKIK